MSRTGVRTAAAALLCALVGIAAHCLHSGRPDETDAPAGSARRDETPRAARTRAVDPTAGTQDAAKSAADADRAAARHALNGTVRAADGRVLAGAIVRAEPVPAFPHAPETRKPVEATADAAGAFDVRGLAAGDWAFLVSAEGALCTYVATVRVPDRERFDLVLPRGGGIEGTVIDETTHAAVSGAHVRLDGLSGPIGDAQTSSDGRFRMALYDEISGDRFRLESPGYASRPAGSSIDAFDENVRGLHEVTLVATRGSTVAGTVVGPDGPVAGAHVLLRTIGGEDAAPRWNATTDAAGSYAIEHLDRHDYWLLVAADGLVQEGEQDPETADPADTYGALVDPREDGGRVAEIRMRARTPLRHCTITGHVIDGERHPLAGASVRTRQPAHVVSTTSAADGSFVLADVLTQIEDTGIGLRAELDGHLPYVEGVTVEAGQTTADA